MTVKKNVFHLLSCTISLDEPVDDVSIHLSEYKWSIVLYSQISLLDGPHWTWTAAKLT